MYGLTADKLDEMQAGLLDTARAGVAIASHYYTRMVGASCEAERWLIGVEYLDLIRFKVFGKHPGQP